MISESLGSVKLTKVEAAVEQIKKYYEKTPERIEDIDISFEYIIASFFPDVFENIKNRLKDEHTLGYIEGYTAKIEEGNNNENS